MARESKQKYSNMRARIAAAAARIMAEDGVEDFATAKRKAARQLGAFDTQSLPTNEEVESELLAYLALYQGEESRSRLHELRVIALAVMRGLASFNPYLTGPVLRGTASRYADIDLQLFTDDRKGLELFLLNRNVPYELSECRRYCGDEPREVQVLRLEWDGIPLSLAVHAAKDERSALKASPGGRTIERAGINAVSALVASDGPTTR
jgi:hypothetical protein